MSDYTPKSGYLWFKAMANGGAVTRYHTRPMLRPQCVAAHSWGVAMVLMASGHASAALVTAALVHDNHEYETGDSPGHIKWANPAFAQMLDDMGAEFDTRYGLDRIPLTDVERLLLRWADIFELVHHCIVDARMGNTLAHDIINRGMGGLRKHLRLWEMNEAVPTSITDMTSALFNEAQVYID
jgi:5'-deoxynucleotidase YfbR-like HD superfamily hydrolase